MPAPRRVSPVVILVLLVGFLLLRAALFAVTTASEYALYLEYATTARESSLAELHRARPIEYPPLATIFGIAVAHLADALPPGTEQLTAWRPELTRGPAPARYEVALGLVLFAVDVACLVLIYLIARRIYPDDDPLTRVGRLALYVAATTAIGLILFDRQDLVVGFVAVLALAAFIRGWSVLAYAILVAGTAYKLVPVLLLPLCVFAFAAMKAAPCSTGRFLRAILRESLIAGAILALFPVLAYLFCGGERAFVFLTFHSARGLQVEASSAWLVVLLDSSTALGHSFGSYTLRGTLADQVARATTLATMAIVALSVLIAARGFWRTATSPRPPYRNELVTHLAASSLLVWLGFILFSKVGSPQYLLWLAPLMPLLPLRGADRRWATLLLLGMVVTTLVYPCLYVEVKGPQTSRRHLERADTARADAPGREGGDLRDGVRLARGTGVARPVDYKYPLKTNQRESGRPGHVSLFDSRRSRRARMGSKRTKLSFAPLTPDRWADFELLFGDRGACGGCWCMFWRLPRKEFEAGKGTGNKAAMKAIIKKGDEPGLLAYSGHVPVGWCAVAPREDYSALGRSRVLKAVDDTPVWSVSCLFVAKSHRGLGVSVELLKAATRFVAEQGGTVIEGYPVEPKTDKMPDAFAWTGLASAFLRAGFHENHRGSVTRPIMRMVVRSNSSTASVSDD